MPQSCVRASTTTIATTSIPAGTMLPPSRTRESTDDSVAKPIVEPAIQAAFSS
jgi:hypothetical protein